MIGLAQAPDPTIPDTSGIVLPGWAGPLVVALVGISTVLGVLLVVATRARAVLAALGLGRVVAWITDRQARLDARALGRIASDGVVADAVVVSLRADVTALQDAREEDRAHASTQEARHRSEMTELRETHGQEMDTLRHSHRTEMDSLRDVHTRELDELRRSLSDALRQVDELRRRITSTAP